MYNYDLAIVTKGSVKSEYSTSIPSVTNILSLTNSNYDTWLAKLEANFDFDAAKKRIFSNKNVAKAISRGAKVASALETGKDVQDKATQRVLDLQRELMSSLDVVQKEAPLAFKDIYWGKADCVAKSQEELVIVDNKCVNKPLKTGRNNLVRPSSYKSYALQVTAYAKAHNEMFGTNIETGLLYFVEGDGTSELTTNIIEVDVNEYWDEWQYRVRDFYQRQTLIKQRELQYYTRRVSF